jgi:hypothetical protein
MDALGVIMAGAGGFLLFAAVKGEHPWTLFTKVLSPTTVDEPAGPDQLTPSSAPIPGVSSPEALQNAALVSNSSFDQLANGNG